jgi:hypothetical protein
MKRLGKNLGRYLGETIDVDAVVDETLRAAEGHGWAAETFFHDRERHLTALRRKLGNGARRLYISTGIHGDEPAGPLAAQRLLAENVWPADCEIWFCPCLNPTGFRLNQRENAEGIDLNRQYLRPQAPETVAHIAWLKQQPAFDLALCLHEDWESHGFYVYELNPDKLPSLAEPMIRRVEPVCPIDRSELIEGRVAAEGIVRPSSDPLSRPDWPEAFYLFHHHTRLSYTLESPSDFPLATRVDALAAGVRAALGV